MREMNRREMLKISSTGALAAFAATVPGVAVAVDGLHGTVPKWEVFELVLQGPSTGNPFLEVELAATFKLGSRTMTVDGFYDGAGRYKIRFMPDEQGDWSYTTRSGVKELNGRVGRFVCVGALPEAHGPVRVHNTHHFAYADGMPYFPFGTTCYAWIHQGDELESQTLKTLRTSPFNKIRMCLFPKSYEYNHNEPTLYPFERNAAGESDFSRPNPAFFAHLEERIVDLGVLGIEADLILFHPYDRWGYSTMSPEDDDRYLRYVLARLSAHRNVWWSLANEFDLMKAKTVADFDRLFHLVEQHDPVVHLRSVHYSKTMYDYTHSWVTHASLQSYDFEAAAGWLKAWGKPIVYDEVMYEGNLNRRWGNISGEEMTRRFWLGVIAGCYVTHGETYLDPSKPLDENTTPTLWWSHGGTLRGTSPDRIAFLRKLVEEAAGLEAVASPYYLSAASLDATGRMTAILYYMDFHQPIFFEFPLPEGSFTAELIDPWQMTVTVVQGNFSGKTKLRLLARPYQAVRFRRIS